MNQDKDFPEKLFAGRFRMMIDYLIDYQAADPDAISEADRQIYADAYERPGAISAANRWYQAFLQDVADAREYPPLSPPVLALGGRFFPYVRLLMEGRAKNAQYVEFKGAGHYLAEERPEDMIRELSAFFGAA